MFDPIVKTIEVPCSQEAAFQNFVERMGDWWPLKKFSTSAMSSKIVKSLRAEPKQGGKIMETSADDSEYLWGTIKSYDPYNFISMNFHVPHPSEEIGPTSLVEVRFTPLENKRTQVKLTQSNWEAFGEKERAVMIRNGYNQGWAVIFEQEFKSACSG